ncbi:uncharacterized protein LOC124787667 isoform X2 [Schistocerca piceifrons]|uniref:uncharacterized protein LOC124787667 isoform X2 n=1 Tax=Schistocerca piceifrons TaxID=274613 RepID=UPI001F5E8E7D|nr:uncharacterized protein LOC124787667 isoform X2 [Schistocerca piceifrons]
MQSRPIRELEVTRHHAALVQYRGSYNGAYEQASLLLCGKKGQDFSLKEIKFSLPSAKYEGDFKISAEKYRDLQALKDFAIMKCKCILIVFCINPPSKKHRPFYRRLLNDYM